MQKFINLSFLAVFLFACSLTLAPYCQAVAEEQIEGVGMEVSDDTAPTSTILPWTDQCVVEVFGSDSNFVYTGGMRLRGNIFAVDSTVNLVAHKMYLTNPASTNIYFVIYEATVQTGPYTIFNQVQKTIGAGEGWYSSGPINVTLSAGNYYLIAACWEGSLTYYCDGTLPTACSFGSQIYNVQPNVYPPDQTFVGTLYTNTSYYQMLVTNDGNGPPFIVDLNWISGPPGNLIYSLYLEYLGSVPVDFDAWLAYQYQGGALTTLIMRSFVNFQPGWSINRPTMFFPVPGGWPGGEYTFWLRIGDHPGTVWAEDYFDFTNPGSTDGSFSGSLPILDNALNPFDEIVKGDMPDGAAYTVPADFALTGAYPNPFNPTTTFSFALPEASNVMLNVYNLTGQLVDTIVNGMRDAGTHSVTFDASHLSSGVYLYQITAGDHSAIGKMVLVK